MRVSRSETVHPCNLRGDERYSFFLSGNARRYVLFPAPHDAKTLTTTFFPFKIYHVAIHLNS